MNRAELLRALEEARTAGKARARMLLDDVLPALGAPWIDGPMRMAIGELADRCGRRVAVPAERTLGLGETWLLLVGPGERGDVVRLCAHGEGRDGGIHFEEEISLALRGLRAAAARQHKPLPLEIFFRRYTVAGGLDGVAIRGGSLGLAACVAALSSACGVAPGSNVAGSARVDETGKLIAVDGIAAKLRALRVQWPHVDTVVLAAEQTLVPEDLGLTVVRAGSIDEALTAFGLTFPEGSPRSKQALRGRLRELHDAELLPHPVDEWMRLSVEAEVLSDELHELDADGSAEALLLSGILASHAGNPCRARAVLARFPAHGQPAELVARERVLTAAASIDTAPEEALAIAIEGVALCKALDGKARAAWYGRALGTHGRVHLHEGRLPEAEPLLREALAHHAKDPDEAPRSMNYLAQCLRHQGRAQEALDLAQVALEQVNANIRSEQSASTRLYCLLEKGRALLDLGRVDEAIEALEAVVDGQSKAAAYPSLGARRSLVRAYRVAGDLEAARRHLRVCIDVAMAPSENLTLRKVGAVAAAEELGRAATGGLSAISRGELERAGEVVAPRQLPVAWIY